MGIVILELRKVLIALSYGMLGGLVGLLVAWAIIGVGYNVPFLLSSFLLGWAGGYLFARVFTLRSWIHFPPMVGVALLVLYALTTFNNFGMLPAVFTSYSQAFGNLHQAMGEAYPHFADKGIDWESLGSLYSKRVENARSIQEFHQIIAEMLACLEDGNARLVASPLIANRVQLGAVRPIETQAVVTEVSQHLQLAGLEPGAVILRRSGLELPDYFNTFPPGRIAGSTIQQQLHYSYNQLLCLTDGEEAVLRFIAPNGVERSSLLTGDPTLAWQPPIGEWRLLDSELGYVSLRRLDNSGMKFLDSALNDLLETRGLVVDVRGTSGGNWKDMLTLGGRFFNKTVYVGEEYFPARYPLAGWVRVIPGIIQPRKPVYDGLIVVLTDPQTQGAAQSLAAALKDLNRGTILGERTSGAGGRVAFYKIPQGVVSFPVSDYQRLFSEDRVGLVVVPDIDVAWHLEDVRKGIDPQLTAAEAYLRNRLASKDSE